MFFLQGGLRGRLGQGQKGEAKGRRKGKWGEERGKGEEEKGEEGNGEEERGGKGGAEGELWEWDGGVFLVKVGQGE